jgi:cytochrome c-type protein NapC/trimethylamine-N-oxide reductase cytochrome c-type subunit TorC
MKKFIKPAIFIVIGIIIAFPLFSLSYYTMVRTSTPEFCASCHEIKPAVVAWRSSTHTNNASGVVVDCMDCHLPAPVNTFDFFFAKTYHGMKDVAIHFFVDEYDREKPLLETASARNATAICSTCHINAAPCWPIAQCCMQDRVTRKNASIVIMIWCILKEV